MLLMFKDICNIIRLISLLVFIALAPGIASATIISDADLAGHVSLTGSNRYSADDTSVEIRDSDSWSRTSQGIWEFNLDSVYAANSDISSASVSLIGGGIVGNLSTPVLLDIYGYIGDGAVTTADWNVGSLIGNITWDGLSAITFDTTQFLSDILNDSAQWLGINIRLSQTAPSSGYIAFNTTYTLTTELSSADVPEPITLVLMMIGLIGLGFSTRQRQLIVIKSNSLK